MISIRAFGCLRSFMTIYVVDYYIFERVQLYTYDVIHENLGFQDVLGRDDRVWLAVYSAAVGNGRASASGVVAVVDECFADRDGGDVPDGLGDFAWYEHAEVCV